MKSTALSELSSPTWFFVAKWSRAGFKNADISEFR
jgi:hypothetical protein